MFATGIIPWALFFIGPFFITESPRWLYKASYKEKSLKVFIRIGGTTTFLFLALMSFLQWLFTYLYVPKTKGKLLEEIEQLWYKKKVGTKFLIS